MRIPIPTGPEMVQVIKRNSLADEFSRSSCTASDSRKLEELAKFNKPLKVSIATDSAHG